MNPETMEKLQKNTAELSSRLSNLSGRLAGLNLPGLSMGLIASGTVPVLNSSTDGLVQNGKRASTALDNVNRGIKTTQDAHANNEATQREKFNKFNSPTPPPKLPNAPTPTPPNAPAPAPAPANKATSVTPPPGTATAAPTAVPTRPGTPPPGTNTTPTKTPGTTPGNAAAPTRATAAPRPATSSSISNKLNPSSPPGGAAAAKAPVPTPPPSSLKNPNTPTTTPGTAKTTPVPTPPPINPKNPNTPTTTPGTAKTTPVPTPPPINPKNPNTPTTTPGTAKTTPVPTPPPNSNKGTPGAQVSGAPGNTNSPAGRPSTPGNANSPAGRPSTSGIGAANIGTPGTSASRDAKTTPNQGSTTPRNTPAAQPATTAPTSKPPVTPPGQMTPGQGAQPPANRTTTSPAKPSDLAKSAPGNGVPPTTPASKATPPAGVSPAAPTTPRPPSTRPPSTPTGTPHTANPVPTAANTSAKPKSPATKPTSSDAATTEVLATIRLDDNSNALTNAQTQQLDDIAAHVINKALLDFRAGRPKPTVELTVHGPDGAQPDSHYTTATTTFTTQLTKHLNEQQHNIAADVRPPLTAMITSRVTSSPAATPDQLVIELTTIRPASSPKPVTPTATKHVTNPEPTSPRVKAPNSSNIDTLGSSDKVPGFPSDPDDQNAVDGGAATERMFTKAATTTPDQERTTSSTKVPLLPGNSPPTNRTDRSVGGVLASIQFDNEAVGLTGDQLRYLDAATAKAAKQALLDHRKGREKPVLDVFLHGRPTEALVASTKQAVEDQLRDHMLDLQQNIPPQLRETGPSVMKMRLRTELADTPGRLEIRQHRTTPIAGKPPLLPLAEKVDAAWNNLWPEVSLEDFDQDSATLTDEHRIELDALAERVVEAAVKRYELHNRPRTAAQASDKVRPPAPKPPAITLYGLDTGARNARDYLNDRIEHHVTGKNPSLPADARPTVNLDTAQLDDFSDVVDIDINWDLSRNPNFFNWDFTVSSDIADVADQDKSPEAVVGQAALDTEQLRPTQSEADQILDDQTWRHASSDPYHPTYKQAGWFEPSTTNHIDVKKLQHLRAHAHTTTVSTEGVQLNRGTVIVPGLDAPPQVHRLVKSAHSVGFDHQILTDESSDKVEILTVKHYTPKPDFMTEEDLKAAQEKAQHAVDQYFNQGYRFPNGNQIHVELEFVNASGETTLAPLTFQPGNGRANVENMPLDRPLVTWAHELAGHPLGLFDEYIEDGPEGPVFLQHPPLTTAENDYGRKARQGRPIFDDGFMAQRMLDEGAGLKARNAWQIANVIRSQTETPVTPYSRHPDIAQDRDFWTAMSTLAAKGSPDALARRETYITQWKPLVDAYAIRIALGMASDAHQLDDVLHAISQDPVLAKESPNASGNQHASKVPSFRGTVPGRTTGEPDGSGVKPVPPAPGAGKNDEPRSGRVFDFAADDAVLTREHELALNTLAGELADTVTKRAASGHLPPVVTISGGPAHIATIREYLGGELARRGHALVPRIVPGGQAGVSIDWTLRRPAGTPAGTDPGRTGIPAPVTTVITSPQPQGKHPVLDDESWRHSPATPADTDWAIHPHPVSTDLIDAARVHAPATLHVSEASGLTDNSIITTSKDGTRPRLDFTHWRGPIAFETRRLLFPGQDGNPDTIVQDRTFRIHLENEAAFADTPDKLKAFKDTARQGITEVWNNNYRLPYGDQLHYTLEFTTDPALATGHITIAPPGTPPNQLTIPINAEPHVFAHEIGGHYGGLNDQYLENKHDNPSIFTHTTGTTVTHTDGTTSTIGTGNLAPTPDDPGIMGPHAATTTAHVMTRDLWNLGHTGPNPHTINPITATATTGTPTTTPAGTSGTMPGRFQSTGKTPHIVDGGNTGDTSANAGLSQQMSDLDLGTDPPAGLADNSAAVAQLKTLFAQIGALRHVEDHHAQIIYEGLRGGTPDSDIITATGVTADTLGVYRNVLTHFRLLDDQPATATTTTGTGHKRGRELDDDPGTGTGSGPRNVRRARTDTGPQHPLTQLTLDNGQTNLDQQHLEALTRTARDIAHDALTRHHTGLPPTPITITTTNPVLAGTIRDHLNQTVARYLADSQAGTPPQHRLTTNPPITTTITSPAPDNDTATITIPTGTTFTPAPPPTTINPTISSSTSTGLPLPDTTLEFPASVQGTFGDRVNEDRVLLVWKTLLLTDDPLSTKTLPQQPGVGLTSSKTAAVYLNTLSEAGLAEISGANGKAILYTGSLSSPLVRDDERMQVEAWAMTLAEPDRTRVLDRLAPSNRLRLPAALHTKLGPNTNLYLAATAWHELLTTGVPLSIDTIRTALKNHNITLGRDATIDLVDLMVTAKMAEPVGKGAHRKMYVGLVPDDPAIREDSGLNRWITHLPDPEQKSRAEKRRDQEVPEPPAVRPIIVPATDPTLPKTFTPAQQSSRAKAALAMRVWGVLLTHPDAVSQADLTTALGKHLNAVSGAVTWLEKRACSSGRARRTAPPSTRVSRRTACTRTKIC